MVLNTLLRKISGTILTKSCFANLHFWLKLLMTRISLSRRKRHMASKWPFLMSLPLSSWLLIQFVCGRVLEQHLIARKKKKSCNLLVRFLSERGGTDHNVSIRERQSLMLASSAICYQNYKKMFQNLV